jgi:hypothetical protein
LSYIILYQTNHRTIAFWQQAYINVVAGISMAASAVSLINYTSPNHYFLPHNSMSTFWQKIIEYQMEDESTNPKYASTVR